ncbi:Lsr2 family DNA-binding protein [Streptomyces gardneri]|uniref:Lsr2 family DNA-binding protein n=1 Tax=Streptomyces gardneri TaxID=66892 RepID=UPI0037D77AF7
MTNTPATPAGSTRTAHEAVALSMHTAGASEQAIREATGLTEGELSDLIADQVLGLPHTDTASIPPAIDVPVIPLSGSDILRQLLAWAAAHPAARVRKRAACITADLAELTERREGEAAQREAEARVAKAKAALEQAEQELRAVKTVTRSTAAAVAPTPICTGTSGAYSRDELTAIRTWSREHGHQVADRGLPSKTVLDAYDTAHPAAPAWKAG